MQKIHNFNARDAENNIFINKIQLPPKCPRKTCPHFQFSILTTVPPVPNTVDVLLVLEQANERSSTARFINVHSTKSI